MGGRAADRNRRTQGAQVQEMSAEKKKIREKVREAVELLDAIDEAASK